MIGQCNLQSRIEQLIKNRTFPRFSILVGPKGSGKKTLAHEIGHMFNAWRVSSDYVDVYRLPDVKIDTVREIITQAYKRITTMVYIIPDADSMSNAAKNALLKVTEEPPNEAYFIMTLEDESNTLETIRSRATIFHMDRYTPDELEEYYRNKFCLSETTIDLERKEILIVRELCSTPGDVETIMTYDATNFYDYVQLVVDNISEVSLANALKISEKIAMKDEPDKYDLKLFWRAFQSVCIDKAGDGIIYCEYAAITSEYMKKLRIKGINKQMLFDNWIFTIREIIYDGRRVKSRS